MARGFFLLRALCCVPCFFWYTRSLAAVKQGSCPSLLQCGSKQDKGARLRPSEVIC